MTTDTTPTPLVVLDHDPDWRRRGLALAGELRSALNPSPLHAEHIGSTAIPGMAAKPVLDLQLTVADLAEAERAFDPVLAELGFELTPHRRDHVPAGLDSDPADWVKRLWRRRGHAGPDCNLHVRLAGSPNERLALLFRDWFRAHPQAVPAYARFKRELAGAVGDIDVYSDVKDPVVDLVVTVAEEWADATGWAPHAERP
ncbi:GrpB family protein [Kitasatospora viridis]|uniref:GrpB-like predicted nucleotidyltransferase (UPF0157 family) n=1 Tax=Kitasatospora viridis TaxID=281105 RepID=A0A561SEA8_9ACTN|nr:GrpB family protein [Kitasatospora viridis]TWF73206.1 GrpB-like predicted nucleotidyltransferase (UPF0157 family) [Kitasatospora viridis]